VEAERLLQRASIVRAIRGWMDARGYREVHTPALVPSAAFEEHLEAVTVGRAFLHTSPEMAMKRVLAAGLCRIYQIAPAFREEELGVHHTREFTMLEWYRVGAGTHELMDEVEDLFATCARSVGRDLGSFRRVACSALLDPSLEPDAWFHRWVDSVEPSLGGAVIVHGYPAWQSALARIRGTVAERFEVYVDGVELGNAFAEETDGRELRRRLDSSNAARSRAGRAPHPVDEQFFAAVSRMPRAAGIAVGLDRLAMVLTGASSIAEVQVGREL